MRFGTKVIEVATFRRQVPPEIEPLHRPGPADLVPDVGHMGTELFTDEARSRQIHRDNTFGTPEEDAFRRDFTVNALFYDVATFSIIDYVGGIDDLREGRIRCIGDPLVRFVEDPVRMLRAIVLAARLDFRIDPPILEAIMRLGSEMAKASPARLLDEYYKVLRSGASLRAFHLLGEVGLLQHITPEVTWPLPHRLEHSLGALDDYRLRFDRSPDTLTNPVLLGSLAAPLGLLRARRRREPGEAAGPGRSPVFSGLPVARRDLEHLDHLLALQPRLADPDALTPRARQALMHRVTFRDGLTWLEIHGDAADSVARWQALVADTERPLGPDVSHDTEPRERIARPPRRRRRRRPRREPTED